MALSWSGVKEVRQPIGVLHRPRAQNERIKGGEDCGVDTDAKCQSKDSNTRKTGVLAKHARAEPKVLQKRIEQWQGAAVAHHFFGLLDASEFDERLAAGFGGGHACAKIVFDVQLEMGFQLGGEVALATLSSK